ncbi:ZIP family metal transporter [Singulisphaera sp. Ch08]|uniref:ZIP family metal transporter n=1 Tax=Singulisphaera sp. Ch08 TaxID=3120278 RepID=A0AAU7CQQ5_9BACT
MTTTLVLFCVAIVGVSVLGGLLPLATVLTHTRLQGYLSFSAGAMLGAAFFHMMPEAVRMGSAHTLNWSAFGLLALFFLERFFAFHHHEAPADPTEPCPTHAHEHTHGRGHSAGLVDSAAPGGSASGTKGTSLHWGAAAFGLAAHSLAGGVALASASVIAHGQPTGLGAAAWGVFLATIIHKPADALTIVSLMLRAGAPRMLAHLVNLGFALMIPLGVGIFLLGMDKMGPDAAASATAAALAFSAGTFLCIALSDLLPELQFHEHDRVFLSLALLAGFALMGLTSMWEPSDAHDHAPHKHSAIPARASSIARG